MKTFNRRVILLPVLILTIGMLHGADSNGDKLTLVAGGGSGGDGTPAANAAVKGPFGVGFDGDGNMYIAEFAGHRVRKIDTKGVLTTIAGTGQPGGAGDGGPAIKAEFNRPHNLIVSPTGDIYVADSDNYRVRKIDSKTGLITALAGTGKKGYSGDGGPANKAELDGVASLAFSPAGDKIYLTGFSAYVRVVDLKSGVISTIHNLPGGRAIAVDSKGALYVTSGLGLKTLGTDGQVRMLVDKSASPALKGPKHLYADKQDNIIIADEGNHLVRKFIVSENKLVTLAGTGKPGTGGIGGPPEKAELNRPHGVYVDSAGMLYIADSFNDRVLKIAP